MNGYFTYLSGYTDNGTARSSLLTLHLAPSLRLYPNGQAETTLFGCRGEDHGMMGKGEDI